MGLFLDFGFSCIYFIIWESLNPDANFVFKAFEGLM